MITADEADAQTVKIEPSGLEKITPAIVDELDAIFEHVAGEVDTVALASLLLKLTGRAKTTQGARHGRH